MKILLALPPMAQFNMPYPATPYLKGYLESRGYEVTQRDWSVELACKLFSKEGLIRVRDSILISKKNNLSESVGFFLEASTDYINVIDSVLRFLQGKDPSLALRLAERRLVPEGPRFMVLDENAGLLENFGKMGVQDQAKYIGSLFIDDLADVIRDGVDSEFGLSRYGEKLASSMLSFTPLLEKIKKPTLIDTMIDEIVAKDMQEIKPDVVGLSAPFPGNILGAMRAFSFIKKNYPEVKTVLGGGYVNTELRHMQDSRPFNFFDFLIFDDGERPMDLLLKFLKGEGTQDQLLRTWFLKDGKIERMGMDVKNADIAFKKLPGPTFRDLPMQNYISMCEMPNPMHRMWSDFRWNKMILAHGCYWKKCTFCDISLDYIERYEPAKAGDLVDQMEKIIAETGQSGFHFVDEAAPPALLKALSEEIIKRGLKVSWWGNLRFDPQFTPEVAELMADAGCVAVTGGLEVASPRLLKLIDKGISIEQVRIVTGNFSKAGIYVHAYLMYGFPTQTKKETVESLEVVRGLFLDDCIQSAYWHRFACTAHSPVGQNPEKFSSRLLPLPVPKEGLFAWNEIPYDDGLKVDHDKLGQGLKAALYNYMHGLCLEVPVTEWFHQ